MTEALQELGDYIQAGLSRDVRDVEIRNAELIVHAPAAGLLRIMKFLRDDTACQFKVLIDVTAVDFPDRDPRFDVVYMLLSMTQNQRIRVKVPTDADSPIPSVTPIFSAAGWFERETWDMYGVFFAGHPDLRRILSDYGFEGHPLRKDFPLTGYVEVRYDEAQKRVVYEPVSLTQEFRNFDFLSPWEGLHASLPGDEKAGEQEAGGA